MGIPSHLIPSRFLEAESNRAIKAGRRPRGTGAKSIAKAASLLEQRFSMLWVAMGGPEILAEQMLVSGRKWRFDFSRREAMTAIEIHGGVWSRGRHTRGAGFIADRRKMNAAQALGWMVIELTGDDIHGPDIGRLIGVVREREINLKKSLDT